MPKSSVSLAAWVPLPAPGGPSRMRLSSLTGRADYLFEEALVVAHHQLRLELLHRVQRDAHHDQDRGASEVEVGARLVEQDRREGRDRRQVQGAGEGQPGKDAVEELRRRSAWPHPGDEAAVLLEVVGLLDR